MSLKFIPQMAMVFACLATPIIAQDAVAEPKLIVELNTAQTTDTACRLSFMVTNEHPDPVEAAVFETVLFNADGNVNQLTLFDFGTLPSNRPRIRQFDVTGIACDGLGRLLINGAVTCEASAPDLCVETLELKSRTDIEVLG